MLFDIAAPPESKFLYQPPKFVKPRSWFEKMSLEATGFKYNKQTGTFSGEKSGWGKVSSWTGAGIGADKVFGAVAKREKADDAFANAQLDEEHDWGKLQTVAGVGLAAAGVATGNPGLVGSGIKLGTSGLGQVGSTPQDTFKEQTASDRGTQYWFKQGGKMKSFSEDIAMIDKKSGKKIGETSYGERIFSVKDNSIMEKLSRTNHFTALGKHVAKVMKKHDANESKSEKMSEGEMKDGGMPKAKGYQDGGDITPEFADSVMQANKKLNFVDRYLNPEKYPKINNPDGSVSTHKMAQQDNYIFPTIVQMPDGTLKELKGKGLNSEAYQYAMKTGQFIKLASEAEAIAMAANGYKLAKQNSSALPNPFAPEKTLHYEKGGKLSADKAAIMLKDNQAHGKKLTGKQKRYFEFIKHGGSPKYWKGGKIKKYAAGNKILPTIDSQEYQDWLTQHGDLLKSSSSQDLFDQFLAEWKSGDNSNFDITNPTGGDMSPAYDPTTNTGGDPNFSDSKLSGNDWANIAAAGATGLFDIAKFITGLHGAGKALPTWRMPEDWVNYLHKTRDMADQGFTAPETANASNERFRNYSMDKANIENYSGGSNAFALGNEGAAINRLNAASGDFAAKDAVLHRSNLGTFGDAAYKTIPFDRQLFEDKYNLAFLNKKTAGELGQQGLQGLFDTAQNFQYTAPGSLYDQMMKQQIEYFKSLNKIDWSKAYTG